MGDDMGAVQYIRGVLSTRTETSTDAMRQRMVEETDRAKERLEAAEKALDAIAIPPEAKAAMEDVITWRTKFGASRDRLERTFPPARAA